MLSAFEGVREIQVPNIDFNILYDERIRVHTCPNMQMCVWVYLVVISCTKPVECAALVSESCVWV